jgi:biopolymer transport protein ExbD
MSRRGKNQDNPEIVLPITPMLDMAFQLLTFFIFTYHPSALEGQMDFSMPPPTADTQASSAMDVKKDTPSLKQEDPDLPKDILLVKAGTQHNGTDDGKICSVTVQGTAGTRTVSVEKHSLDELVKYLTEARKDLPPDPKTQEPTTLIKIQGDSKLTWGEMVRLMDACREAGFSTHKFVQPTDFVPGGRF